jgi:hypothetical protein
MRLDTGAGGSTERKTHDEQIATTKTVKFVNKIRQQVSQLGGNRPISKNIKILV